MKVVNYSINTFYVLKMAIGLRSLKLFLKKWEFKHLGSFPGLVPFQGDYEWGGRVFASNAFHFQPAAPPILKPPNPYAPQFKLISCITFFLPFIATVPYYPGTAPGGHPGIPGTRVRRYVPGTVYCAVSYCCI